MISTAISPRLGPLGVHFAQACGFAPQRAQIIQFGPPDVGRAQYIDLVDHFGIRREDALDTLAKAHLADGEARLVASPLRNDDALERLQAFLVAFLDLDVNPDGVAGFEVGEVATPRLGEKPVNNW